MPKQFEDELQHPFTKEMEEAFEEECDRELARYFSTRPVMKDKDGNILHVVTVKGKRLTRSFGF